MTRARYAQHDRSACAADDGDLDPTARCEPCREIIIVFAAVAKLLPPKTLPSPDT